MNQAQANRTMSSKVSSAALVGRRLASDLGRMLSRRRGSIVAFRWNSPSMLILVPVFTVATLGASLHRAPRVEPVVRQELVVRMTIDHGDTIWSLASRYGDPAENIEDRMYDILQENDLKEGTPLIRGQKLLVPITNPDEIAAHRNEVAAR